MPAASAPSPSSVESDLSNTLPAPETRHWAAHHKAAVVAAVDSGAISLEDASKRYRLTEEEFWSWKEAIKKHGVAGLRTVTRERRTAARMVVSEPGTAKLNAATTVNCVIGNISDFGARIRFEAGVAVPNVFELHCRKSGRSWWVETVWQSDRLAGVRFSNPLPPPWTIRSGLAAWLLGKRSTVCIDRIDGL
jgi:hypothetical protein